MDQCVVSFFFPQPPELTNESLCINQSISGLFLRHILLDLSVRRRRTSTSKGRRKKESSCSFEIWEYMSSPPRGLKAQRPFSPLFCPFSPFFLNSHGIPVVKNPRTLTSWQHRFHVLYSRRMFCSPHHIVGTRCFYSSCLFVSLLCGASDLISHMLAQERNPDDRVKCHN